MDDDLHPNQALDYPFQEVHDKALALIQAGAKVYFKFTCEVCGARQTFDEVNKLYTQGRCEECNHVTSLVENGCNYVVIFERT